MTMSMIRAYEVIGEQIMPNAELRAAMELVLGFQQELHGENQRNAFDLSETADVAARKEAYAHGIQQGFELAHNEVLDLNTITERIEGLKESLEDQDA